MFLRAGQATFNTDYIVRVSESCHPGTGGPAFYVWLLNREGAHYVGGPADVAPFKAWLDAHSSEFLQIGSEIIPICRIISVTRVGATNAKAKRPEGTYLSIDGLATEIQFVGQGAAMLEEWLNGQQSTCKSKDAAA